MSGGILQPTWQGHVTTAKDALILFEACLNGTLHHVARRPHDRERTSLIRSGCVFIYEENASGIKRWTDGVPWSPSRILGNFLVYRELLKPFPPGEKKRATKRTKRVTKPGEPYPRVGDDSPTSPMTPTKSENSESREQERALIGSLVDSYGFKEGGLVKKTMSVNVHGVHHHLVSYYTMADASDGSLNAPAQDSRLKAIIPRNDLVARQNFRASLDETEDGQDGMISPNSYSYYPGQDPHRPPMMMSPAHAQHPSYTGMPIYGGMPYSSTPHMPGAYAYTSMPAGQNYYAAQANPQGIKQEQYETSYARSQLPQPSYGYRAGMLGMVGGPSAIETRGPAADQKPGQDGSHWPRTPGSAGGGPMYAATGPPQQTNPPSQAYASQAGGWNSMTSPTSHGAMSQHQRSDSGWNQDGHANWAGMQNPLGPPGPRQQQSGYPAANQDGQ